MGYCWCDCELLCPIWVLCLWVSWVCFTDFLSLFGFVYTLVVCLYCLFVTFNYYFELVFVDSCFFAFVIDC